MIIVNRIIGCVVFLCILMICRLLLFPMRNIFMLKNRNKLMLGVWILSIILTIIGYFIHNIVFGNPADYIGIVWLGISAFFGLIFLLAILSGQKKRIQEKLYVEIRAEDYKLYSESEFIGNETRINNYALWNNNGKIEIIQFFGPAPTRPVNIIAKLVSLGENKYNCQSFIILEKRTLKEMVSLMINIYMIILIIYGLYQICLYDVPNNDVVFIIMPIMYFLFKFIKDSLENATSSYDRIMGIFVNVFYWLFLSVAVLIPFVN